DVIHLGRAVAEPTINHGEREHVVGRVAAVVVGLLLDGLHELLLAHSPALRKQLRHEALGGPGPLAVDPEGHPRAVVVDLLNPCLSLLAKGSFAPRGLAGQPADAAATLAGALGGRLSPTLTDRAGPVASKGGAGARRPPPDWAAPHLDDLVGRGHPTPLRRVGVAVETEDALAARGGELREVLHVLAAVGALADDGSAPPLAGQACGDVQHPRLQGVVARVIALADRLGRDAVAGMDEDLAVAVGVGLPLHPTEGALRAIGTLGGARGGATRLGQALGPLLGLGLLATEEGPVGVAALRFG